MNENNVFVFNNVIKFTRLNLEISDKIDQNKISLLTKSELKKLFFEKCKIKNTIEIFYFLFKHRIPRKELENLSFAPIEELKEYFEVKEDYEVYEFLVRNKIHRKEILALEGKPHIEAKRLFNCGQTKAYELMKLYGIERRKYTKEKNLPVKYEGRDIPKEKYNFREKYEEENYEEGKDDDHENCDE